MKRPNLGAPLLMTLLFTSGSALATAPTTACASIARPADRVDELIAEGRAELAAGKSSAAKQLFDQAAEADGHSLRTQVWQLRVAMNLEQMNDVLGRIDQLARDNQGAPIKYLYGMAFAVKAQQAIDAGLTDGTIGMQLIDAQTFLSQALEYDGERFSDGYPVLARVAWMNQDLEAAIAAADKAVESYPKSASSWGQRGRIQLSRFLANKDDEASKDAAKEYAADAVKSLERALELYGDDKDDGKARERAQLFEQLAISQAWRGETAAMAEAYASCMGWDPSVLDFGSIWGTLGANFIGTLADGERQFVARWGDKSQADATLLWYLGYARYTSGDKASFAKAEEELLLALQKWPAYANALWYVALSRYDRGDFVGAGEALVDFWTRDPNSTVATVSADLENAKPRIKWIVGECVGANRLLLAAKLSEVLAQADPPGALDWSYKGLFLRDYADQLVERKKKKADDPEVVALYEESLASYERALELEPENPNFMNDLAVVLDYNLNRDLERCLKLYDHAFEVASRMMDDPEVDEQLKTDFIKIAKRDSKNNAELLRKRLKKEAEERAEAERKQREDEAGA